MFRLGQLTCNFKRWSIVKLCSFLIDTETCKMPRKQKSERSRTRSAQSSQKNGESFFFQKNATKLFLVSKQFFYSLYQQRNEFWCQLKIFFCGKNLSARITCKSLLEIIDIQKVYVKVVSWELVQW